MCIYLYDPSYFFKINIQILQWLCKFMDTIYEHSVVEKWHTLNYARPSLWVKRSSGCVWNMCHFQRLTTDSVHVRTKHLAFVYCNDRHYECGRRHQSFRRECISLWWERERDTQSCQNASWCEAQPLGWIHTVQRTLTATDLLVLPHNCCEIKIQNWNFMAVC